MFAEDAVSVSGDVIGSSIPQGVAAVLIALVLIRVSLRLIQRSHDFLVGSCVGLAHYAVVADPESAPTGTGGADGMGPVGTEPGSVPP